MGYPLTMHFGSAVQGDRNSYKCVVSARGERVPGLIMLDDGENRHTRAPGMVTFYPLEPLPRGPNKFIWTWAYGERDDNMIQTVTRDQMPEGAEIEVGMQLQAESESGVHVVTVVGVEENEIRLDANHPLAGVALNFEVKVVEVRDATADELKHGHVHGAGGHQH